MDLSPDDISILIHAVQRVMRDRSGSMLKADIDLHSRSNALAARLHRERIALLNPEPPSASKTKPKTQSPVA
jgi:hypothetical protein